MNLRDIICSNLNVADKFNSLKYIGAKIISTNLGKVIKADNETVEYDSISDVWTFSNGEVYMENL